MRRGALAVAAVALLAGADGGVDPRLLPVLAGLLLLAKLGGEAVTRLGMPAVLGELGVGIVAGNLGLVGWHGLEFAITDTGMGIPDEKLATIMTAFETQVQPIGQTRYSPGLLSVRRHTKKAARIKLSNGKTAYALVTYTDDVMPKNSQAARQLAAAGRDLARRVDGDDLLDQVNSDADYANAVQPDIEVEFVEWITNPKGTNIDFKGMVDGEAIDVPLNKLKGRPFVDPDGNLLDG